MFWNPFILSASLLISSFTLFNDPLISFVPRWRTTASVSSHIYPFNLGIKCSILIPDVLYTHTASGLSSFGFNCLASPRILESPMIHFFFFDLTTGICLVTFALSSLSDRSLMVCVKSLLLLLLVVLLHSVELLSLLFFSLFLTFWMSKSFLFGCILSILVFFLTVLLCLVWFFPIFIFYHFCICIYTFQPFRSKVKVPTQNLYTNTLTALAMSIASVVCWDILAYTIIYSQKSQSCECYHKAGPIIMLLNSY